MDPETGETIPGVNLRVAVNNGLISILGTEQQDRPSVLLQKGTNIIKLSKNSSNKYPTKLIITHDKTLVSNDTLYVGEIQVVNGYNPIISNSIDINSVLNRIHELAIQRCKI